MILGAVFFFWWGFTTRLRGENFLAINFTSIVDFLAGKFAGKKRFLY